LTVNLKNFTLAEFACKCGCDSDGTEMQDSILQAVQDFRTALGFPFPITSGYRCPKHPIEARKSTPGAHARGFAVDIGVSREQAIELLRMALNDGRIKGVGINQKGAGRFIHLDTDSRTALWTY